MKEYTGIKKKTEITPEWARKLVLGIIKNEWDRCKIIEFPYDKKNRIRSFRFYIQGENYIEDI